MTRDERREQLRLILDRHNEAARAIREASQDFKRAAVGLNQVYAHIEAVADHVQAITAVILEANTAALALFNDDEQP